MSVGFEIGPIRPPSEADSLLIRVTRNCPWNRCKFCGLYKQERFSARSVDEIKEDIDQIAAFRGGILKDKASVFLQDANSVVLVHDKLCSILAYIREKLPNVSRVTSYGRVDSLAKLSLEQLIGLKEAGLDRIHSGYESGSDKVLALINKGHTKAQEIEAGQKVKESGIELSVYFMPGVGGKELSDENARETADVIDKANPDFVRIRTFVSQPGTELMQDIGNGSITECTDKGKMLELKKMIESIKEADGYLFSDHIINLLGNVQGNLATDREKMLAVFEAFESLSEEEQKRYQIARRGGTIWPPEQLDTEEKFEAYLLALLRQYI